MSRPRRIAVGDLVVVERSRWIVRSVDAARNQFVCRLQGGSGVWHRFRRRHISEIRPVQLALTDDDYPPRVEPAGGRRS